MIAYIAIGVEDIARAKWFYSAFLPALGYVLIESTEGLNCVLHEQPTQTSAMPKLYIKNLFDGRDATAGNGTMIAFKAQNQKQVRDLHAAALIAGGSDDGPPGFRDVYGPRFYGGDIGKFDPVTRTLFPSCDLFDKRYAVCRHGSAAWIPSVFPVGESIQGDNLRRKPVDRHEAD